MARRRHVGGHRRLLPLAGEPGLQDTIPRHAVALPRPHGVPRMPRTAAAQGCRLCEGRRPQHQRGGGDARHRGQGVARGPRRPADAGRAEGYRAAAHRAAQPCGLPARRGPRLPHAQPREPQPQRRREPEDKPGHVAGVVAGGVDVHTRRAVDRAAQPRHRAPDRSAQAAARPRQHGDRRGARRGHHTLCRLPHRHRPRSGAPGRRGRLRRQAVGPERGQKLAHGRLYTWPQDHPCARRAAQVARQDKHTRCLRQQPQARGCGHTARRADGGHRRQRQRQEHADTPGAV